MQRRGFGTTMVAAAAASTVAIPACRSSAPAAPSISTNLLTALRWHSIDSTRSCSNNIVVNASSSATACVSSRRSFLTPPTAQSTSPYQTKKSLGHQRGFGGGGSSSSNSNNSRGSPGAGRGPVKDRMPPVSADLADPRRRLAVLVDGSNTNLIPSGCTSLDQLYRTSALFTTVLPAVLEVGVPVLLRVFAHQLPAVWEPLLAGSSTFTAVQGHGTSMSDDGEDAGRHPEVMDVQARHAAPVSLIPLPSPSAATAPDAVQPRIQVEHFRVERFIPLAMQIEADARHLYELRSLNKIEGVCYVCHEVDRAMYVSLMEEQRSGSAGLAGMLQQRAASPAAFFNQYVVDELGMAEERLSDARSKDGS